MNTKQTITVIGEISGEVYSICENLSSGHYRLILCGDEKQNMEAIATKIKTKVLAAEVEVQDCMIEASWEADIIIMAAVIDVTKIAETIREVANQKVVMIGSNGAQYERRDVLTGTATIGNLQHLLPHSKLVQLYFAGSEPDVSKQGGGNKVSVLIESGNKADLFDVAGLLKEAGYDVIIKDDLAWPAVEGCLTA